MLRRSVVHAMLSLLLLFSQQLALSHGLSHWSNGGTSAQSSADSVAGKSLALEKSCHECLAFAQIGSALGSQSFAFFVSANVNTAPVLALATSHCARTDCVFQSRAPPVLV